MTRRIYRFHIAKGVPMSDVARALGLAAIAVESIYGKAAMKLDGVFSMDRKTRTCVMDVESQLGSDLARVFAGFLSLGIGEDAYFIEHDENRGVRGGLFELLRGLF